MCVTCPAYLFDCRVVCMSRLPCMLRVRLIFFSLRDRAIYVMNETLRILSSVEFHCFILNFIFIFFFLFSFPLGTGMRRVFEQTNRNLQQLCIFISQSTSTARTKHVYKENCKFIIYLVGILFVLFLRSLVQLLLISRCNIFT
jgi:hypothetical protein